MRRYECIFKGPNGMQSKEIVIVCASSHEMAKKKSIKKAKKEIGEHIHLYSTEATNIVNFNKNK